MENHNEERNLVPIETYSSQMDAQLAQATLSAAGIESLISSDDAGGMLQYMDYVKGVKLFVDETNLEEAKTLLEQQATPETDEAQPSESL
ncbi:MAG: DUF2007 domain-containing protein [Ignavibacteriae bacterium]|nr:DUF2007 domain-containing protein [Ignavibacteriota bacterium]